MARKPRLYRMPVHNTTRRIAFSMAGTTQNLLACAIASVLGISCMAQGAATVPDAAALVKKSVSVNDADWAVQPKYSHIERDVDVKIGQDGKASGKQEKTYRVMIIGGSPYNQLIALNGEPLSPARRAQEEEKLKAEITRRGQESNSAKSARIQKYQKERAEEHLLMNEMVKAFRFKLSGEESVGGHACYVLDATPNPDYEPPVAKARVLTGMKGRLWIEKGSYHWAKVHAQVFEPVQFGLFVAKVRPGTQFELVQSPIADGAWLPSHFSESVNATVLGIYSIRNRSDEYYSDYHRGKAGSHGSEGAVARSSKQ
jgi:hypothetical protein